MTSSNILIGGGTGFIGSALQNLLRGKGYGVTVVSRMPGPHRISWTELQSKGLPNHTKAVVNLAGQNVMDFSRRWTAGYKQNVVSSRINTTKALAHIIDEAKIKPSVFISMSGVGAYKPDPEKEYTEESQCEQFDFFSTLCKDWESAATLRLATKQHCRLVTIRSGVVLGKDGGMIKQLYMPFCLGLGGPIGNGNQYMPWIHIDDLTGLIEYVIEQPNIEGILNGVAPTPCTNKEFSTAFGKALRRPAILPVPSFVMNTILSKERATMVLEGQKVVPKRTLATGFCYKYPNIDLACAALANK